MSFSGLFSPEGQMKLLQPVKWIGFAALAVWLLLPPALSAQTDEIQVYNASLAPVGKFNLTWHQNYTPIGQKTPAFPGGLVPNHAYIGVPEWAYGTTRWLELGLYLPLYSVTTNQGATLNGFKLRTLFAVPKADERTFFYGANFEFSYNAKQWDQKRFTSEIRPIVGWHLNGTDIIFNPIMDNSYIGLKNLDFAPASRLAHKFSQEWTFAIEAYGDFGAIHSLNSFRDQSHQFYFVTDHTVKGVDVEAGIGVGVTASSDRLTLKLILSRDLN
jgi:hypothetical protein